MASRGRAYCDYNATAPLRPAARAAMLAALDRCGNPSAVHAAGRTARETIEKARETIASTLGVAADRVVFTSGATEALHMALDDAKAKGRSVIASGLEHDAVLSHIEAGGGPAARPAVDRAGRIELGSLAQALEGRTGALAVLTAANGETGVLQPIGAAAELAGRGEGLLLADASQAVGRSGLAAADIGDGYIVLSSHKLGGPMGAGALVATGRAVIAANRHGGGQERGLRPGTENVPAIAGFAAALEDSRNDDIVALQAERDRFEGELKDMAPDAVIFGAHGARLPNTSYFAIPGLPSETAVIALDLDGVAISAGSACSSGKARRSPVLPAMGVEPALARCALRASFGWATQPAEIDLLLSGLRRLVERRASLEIR